MLSGTDNSKGILRIAPSCDHFTRNANENDCAEIDRKHSKAIGGVRGVNVERECVSEEGMPQHMSKAIVKIHSKL